LWGTAAVAVKSEEEGAEKGGEEEVMGWGVLRARERTEEVMGWGVLLARERMPRSERENCRYYTEVY
jgi:hypothetical protein